MRLDLSSLSKSQLYGLFLLFFSSVGLVLAGVLLIVLLLVNFLVHDCSAMMDLNFSISEADVQTNRQPSQTRQLNDNRQLNDSRQLNDNRQQPVAHTRTLNDTYSEQLSEETALINSSFRSRCYSKDRRSVRDSQGSMFGLDTEYSVSVNYSAEHYLARDESLKHLEGLGVGEVLRDLLKQGDVLLMFISTFVFVYSLFAVDVLIPLLTGLVLDWSLTAIGLIFAANGKV